MFTPNPTLRNKHLQTILGSWIKAGSKLTFERRRLETPDGDFIDLDFPASPSMVLSDEAPIVLVIHGMGGSARGILMLQAYDEILALGMRPVGMNCRGCSGEVNRTSRVYHLGATDDVDLAVAHLLEQYNAPVGLLGISLGGNLILKYLGEQQRSKRIKVAATISCSYDFFATARQLETRSGMVYTRYLLMGQKAILKSKKHQIGSLIDYDRALNAKTLREFDDAFTAPLNGFEGVDDYLTKTSSWQFLSTIETPTLLIRSLDDPFFEVTDIPYEIIGKNPFLKPVFTEYGGHVGFLEGSFVNLKRWAQRYSAAFCAGHFEREPNMT